jgi:hypothetical protein
MPEKPKAPFFTWIDEDYASVDDVPERIRVQIISLHAAGVSQQELGEIFHIDATWVDEIIRRMPGYDPRDTELN